jgi:hypothetical protein
LRVDALTGQRRLNGIDTNLLPEDIMTLLAIGKSLPEDGTYVEIGEPTAVSSTLIGLGVKTANNSSANVYSIHDWRRDRADCELEDTGEFYAFSETLQEAGMDCIVTPLLMTAQKALGLFHEKTIDVLHLNLTSRSLDIAADVPGWLARCKDGARILVSTDLATTAIEALAIEITRTVPLANGANCTKLGWLWEIELLTNA